ncbi:MAG: peptide chain release factor N(5)-glutamine methyltransferase [Spirochaetia bacterium]|nr:peptide chain release factor N(5)-glutamine methyltransferase [Spirochaetia bacterium]
MTYARALDHGRKQLTKVLRDRNSAYSEALYLLCYSCKITKEELFASMRDDMPAACKTKFLRLCSLRAKRVPIQYLTGVECFFGREFKVSKGVFIPRPDTESLIEAVLSIADRLPMAGYAADCGTGSGILPVTLLKEINWLRRFYCFDINEKALNLAMTNAMTYGVSRQVKPLKGDFFRIAASLRLRFGFIVSNPPYIKKAAIKRLQKEVQHDPAEALTDGSTGYTFYTKFAQQGPDLLMPGGYLAMEIGDGMGKNVRVMFENGKWEFVKAVKDFRGIERALVFRIKL